ncbi:ATP-dependent DNA helicase [Trichonephila clavipes]|uniref:ATP-dependent DNA helicase n=1 Tax=Trichonephila clavipes TaxID=2585209 RepID=A0A8X6VGE7_TRICX|nr:ATP-dependent DNA helicase [Trichonephila clavipes]
MTVPIVLRFSNIPLNNKKTIFVKRTHVPLVCACATTIHKSQGNTYSEIVYEYDRRHSQSLLYVALSRITSIEGLYITTKNNDKTFYHCRRRSSTTIDLQEEFKRLSLHKLKTINEDLINFIMNRQGLSMFTAHAVDLQDSVIRISNILVLSETWLGNERNISIPNFNCIVKYKRPNTRAGGVVIYQNSSDAVNIRTPSRECSVSQSDIYGTIQSSVGDLCLAECVIDNGQKIIIVAVYITPNKKLDDIIEFLHLSLLPYTSRGSALINKNYDKIPKILSEDFNVNFALDKSLQLIEFLKDNFTLSLQNNRIISTTK